MSKRKMIEVEYTTTWSKSDIDYTCPLCDQEFSSPDYDMKEVWYEPTSDGHFNAYITRFCPHCNENASVAV